MNGFSVVFHEEVLSRDPTGPLTQDCRHAQEDAEYTLYLDTDLFLLLLWSASSAFAEARARKSWAMFELPEKSCASRRSNRILAAHL